MLSLLSSRRPQSGSQPSHRPLLLREVPHLGSTNSQLRRQLELHELDVAGRLEHEIAELLREILPTWHVG